MKGMIRNNWYLASKGALVAQWGVAGALYGIALFSPGLNAGLPFISLFILATVVLSILPALTTIQEETRSHWLQKLVVAPVTRKTILKGKYLSLLLYTVLSAAAVFAICLLYPVLVPAVAGRFTVPVIVQAIMQSVSMALLTSALHIVAAYSFGFAKSDALILVSALIAFVLHQMYMAFVMAIRPSYYLFEAGVLLGLAVIALTISYFVTKRILYRREL